ncbi:unnamed protein product [Leptidea sinapis]|uniref:Amine oxidase domain-containing protein n=1 Tax=Leptidea sinapis TaxID=189913 RepID=A0A5E4Q2H6_9NEOP|nr:unnamed protein product [Leptidea sinapis]
MLRLIASVLLFISHSSSIPQPYDTIVVGLGSAGTTAASTLAKAGRRVLALEAQDRIGGRVKTVPFGDGTVEEGAEWIDGTENSVVYQLGVDNHIDLRTHNTTNDVVKSDGFLLDREIMKDLFVFCLVRLGESPKEPMGLGNFTTVRLKEYINEKYPDLANDNELLKGFLFMMNLAISNYASSNDWNDLTAKSGAERLGGDPHMTWYKSGFKTFFELLLNTYNNGPGLSNLDIKLNTEVTQIKWPRDASGNVEVVCKDGSTYTASNVIVTVSLGVLKAKHKTLFYPELPETKIFAIDNISFGAVVKVILSFPEVWWSVGNFDYSVWWNDVDVTKLSDDEQWIRYLAEISTPISSNNSLILWFSGDRAKLVESLPDEVVKNKSMKVLRQFLGKNFTLTEPGAMIKTSWYTNPFVRGAYSYDNLLTPLHPHIRDDLAAPLVDAAGTPRVLFAGEATSRIHFASVHGASETGKREALRVLKNPLKI